MYDRYSIWEELLSGRKEGWRRKWQPSPVFLPGKSHGQRSLVRYSPWGCKESDMTEYVHRKKKEGKGNVADI